MFTRIAHRYDFMNSVMTGGRHHAWRQIAVRMTALPKEALVLDVGCGTGDFALQLARLSAANVIGVDLSHEMLILAQRKTRASNIQSWVSFQIADALSLPFLDNQFQGATVGFTLRNVINIHSALEELHRVVRPRGKVVILELTPVSSGIGAPLIRFYMYKVIPWLGRMLAQDSNAYTYLPNSVTAFPLAEALADIMRDVGFNHVWFRRLALGTVAIHVGEK